MKATKGGLLWVDRIGDRRSYGILAQDFLWKREQRCKNRNRHAGEGEEEVFCFLLFLPSGACACSGPERSRARPVFGRGGAHP
jgi:hypothetical protein